jgi:aminoglycoside phosphotransferase (APT) family kinase protein
MEVPQAHLQGTSPVPATGGPPMSWERIARYLGAHGIGLDLSVPPRRLSGGLANHNILVRCDGGWAVLRHPPAGPLPAGAHDMAREHRVLSRLASRLALAPRSLHYCADTAVAGVPFHVLEHREGTALRGDSVAPLADTEDTGQRLSMLLVETLASLHAIAPADVGLETLGRPEGFLARTARGWTERGRAAFEGAAPGSGAMGDIAAWLEAHVPSSDGPREPTLLHNDFKLDNLLIDTKTLSAKAILDWDMCTRGDPLFDLATLLSYWTEPGDPQCMTQLAQMPTRSRGFLTREAVAHDYAERTGRSLAHMRFARVLAMFKLAVVFRQLHNRWRRGEVSDARYADFGELAAGLLEFTRDIAAGRVF